MWHDYIAAKRDAENSANGARLLELRAAFEIGQRQLDEQIRRRDSKVAELKRQIEDRKVCPAVSWSNGLGLWTDVSGRSKGQGLAICTYIL